MLTILISLVGTVAVLVGLFLLAPPLALVAVGAALIRYAVLRESEVTS